MAGLRCILREHQVARRNCYSPEFCSISVPMRTAVQKSSSLPTPLGLAVMELRGATEDMIAALERNNLPKALVLRSSVSRAILDYESSRNMADPQSLVTREWIVIGDDSVIAARTMLETAASRLSSSLKSL